jgi:hypothetical protein
LAAHVHALRFSDTFDLHARLDGLPVSMAQLMAICHDIVLRGRQQQQQQQQPGQQAAAGTLQAAAAGTQQAAAAAAADAAPVSPTASPRRAGEATRTTISDTTSSSVVELHPQQLKQQQHTQRQLARLGITGDSRGAVCRPIPPGLAAGVVCFLPRNTDLQQLSELAVQGFGSSGSCCDGLTTAGGGGEEPAPAAAASADVRAESAEEGLAQRSGVFLDTLRSVSVALHGSCPVAAAADAAAAAAKAAAAGQQPDSSSQQHERGAAGGHPGSSSVWRVERNILNDHFKGVTVTCGWDGLLACDERGVLVALAD